MSQDEPLLRHEVRSIGSDASAVVQRSVPILLASGVGVMLFVTLVFLLFTTRYKETQQARGILQSPGRNQQVTAPGPGRIQQWHVKEGDLVTPGQSLATISRSIYDGSGARLSAVFAKELQARLNLVGKEIELTSERFSAEHTTLQNLLDDELQALKLMEDELELSRERLAIGERQLRAFHTLQKNTSATSVAEVDRQKLSILELRRQKQLAHRLLQDQQTEVNVLRRKLAALALKGELALLPLHKQSLNLEQQIEQASREETLVVVAEQAGRVTAITLPAGQSVSAGQLMARIGDPGDDIEAIVYVPSRVAGKLQPGQEVLLSFDAFDFHQYGRYPARINQISKASLDPREQLLPVPGIREPVFRLRASIEQRYVSGSETYRLQPGLLFTADFVLEELPLLYFIFKPVLSLRGLVG